MTTQSQKLAAPPTLSQLFGRKIILFDGWYHGYGRNWKAEREQITAYRNMLCHHGRPWLHFRAGEYTSPPYILRAEHCRLDVSKHEDKKEFLTWGKQIKMFKDTKHESKFIRLDEACRLACDSNILWLNDAYRIIVNKLDKILTESPQCFQKYRNQWGIIGPGI